MNIEHLSFSSITSYLNCAKAWEFKYVDKQPTKTSAQLLFGSAWHKTIEAMVAKSDERDPLDQWKHNLQSELELSGRKNQNIEWGDETEEGLINTGIRFLQSKEIQTALLSIIPGVDEMGPKIERNIELRVPGVPVPVIGYIDIITEDGVCGDFKTSGKSWSETQAKDSLQPLFYLAGLKQMGIPAPDLFRHYIFVKTKEPKFQMIETAHKPQEMMFLFGLIQNVWRAIERESFFENPGGWQCSAKFCDFWAQCRGRFV